MNAPILIALAIMALGLLVAVGFGCISALCTDPRSQQVIDEQADRFGGGVEITHFGGIL